MIRILLKFVSECLIDKRSALIQVMAWRQTGNNPLPEPMLTQEAPGGDELNLFSLSCQKNYDISLWPETENF